MILKENFRLEHFHTYPRRKATADSSTSSSTDGIDRSFSTIYTHQLSIQVSFQFCTCLNPMLNVISAHAYVIEVCFQLVLTLRQHSFTEEMALSTDQLVSDIRRHSAEGDFKMLATQLQNCADQIARMDLAVLNTIIECLDYRAHSLGILAAL